MHIRVAWSPREGEACEVDLDLPEGSRVEDAIRSAGLDASAAAGLGVWGRAREPGHVLTDGDRVELYRPLQLDPKEARRQRAAPRKGNGAAKRPRPGRAE